MIDSSLISRDQKNITDDVSHVLHHVNQFTEVRFNGKFMVDLQADPAAKAKNDGDQYVFLENPRHPYQIDWELFSSEGILSLFFIT